MVRSFIIAGALVAVANAYPVSQKCTTNMPPFADLAAIGNTGNMQNIEPTLQTHGETYVCNLVKGDGVLAPCAEVEITLSAAQAAGTHGLKVFNDAGEFTDASGTLQDNCAVHTRGSENEATFKFKLPASGNAKLTGLCYTRAATASPFIQSEVLTLTVSDELDSQCGTNGGDNNGGDNNGGMNNSTMAPTSGAAAPAISFVGFVAGMVATLMN